MSQAENAKDLMAYKVTVLKLRKTFTCPTGTSFPSITGPARCSQYSDRLVSFTGNELRLDIKTSVLLGLGCSRAQGLTWHLELTVGLLAEFQPI